MNILILGSGGREHALAWKLKKSKICDQLYIAPGNAGSEREGINVALDLMDFEAIGQFVLDKDIGLVFVGPELPLVKGIVDYFQNKSSLKLVKCVGPSANAALLEGSKAFAKKFIDKYQIPTAGYKEFNIHTMEEGIRYIENQKTPVVLKADGLAAGKGVLICSSHEEAIVEFKSMLQGKFGDASKQVVVEEFLSGIEFSVFTITDGKSYKILPIAKDYKRVGKGDSGLNTGGMGAVSPVPFVNNALLSKVEEKIINPTIRGIQEEKMNYKGFIFFGLINVDNDPFVIEYNCRLGDPETQVVIPRLKSDLGDLLTSLFDKTLSACEIKIDPRYATAVVLTSGGYPGSYAKGKEIHLPDAGEVLVFHAGTKNKDQSLLTDGGRVLAVTAFSDSLAGAMKKSQEVAKEITFEGKYYREDIGFDL
jgi:phosphoribosylamine--glycine ligase